MRFVVSHRLSGRTSRTRDMLAAAEPRITADATVRKRKDTKHRSTLVVEGNPKDVVRSTEDLPDDIILEPEVYRRSAVQTILNVKTAQEPGIGASIQLRLTSNGSPLQKAKVSVLINRTYTGASSSLGAISDSQGFVSIPYDPRQWIPSAIAIIPEDGAWPWLHSYNPSTTSIDIPPLPQSGPLTWWHHILGISQYSEERGKGIRIGVADTGVGPHPNLTHITGIGTFLNGSYHAAPESTADIERHGTRVCGIIGAKPAAAEQGIAGISPGASIFAARVYRESIDGADPVASNADIANAVDELSDTCDCDLINLSLGGENQSKIEADAVMSALERGSLVLCAAGNQNGPVMYPAAYPGSVAISAVGLIGTAPWGALDWTTLPAQYDRYPMGGYYVAGFSNVGLELSCTAPGVGIISTVPGSRPAHAMMNGTSMSTAIVTGALASSLSDDALYRQLPHDIYRAQWAWNVLIRQMRSLGLPFYYQGYGIPVVGL